VRLPAVLPGTSGKPDTPSPREFFTQHPSPAMRFSPTRFPGFCSAVRQRIRLFPRFGLAVLFAAGVAKSASTGDASSPVSNVTFAQRTDGSKLVEVRYALAGDSARAWGRRPVSSTCLSRGVRVWLTGDTLRRPSLCLAVSSGLGGAVARETTSAKAARRGSGSGEGYGVNRIHQRPFKLASSI
jgi:hypothetical protein